MMGFLFLQSITVLTIMKAIGNANFFFVLGGFQVITILVLFTTLKETKGLSAAEKKSIYRP
jgi:hypothetical protein